MFFAGSCQQENLEPAATGNTVTYSVSVPEVATKAIGDGMNVNQLVYAVYRVTGETEEVAKTSLQATERMYQKTAVLSNGNAIIPIELINDQSYVILFWAQVEDKWFDGDVYEFGTEGVKYPKEYAPNNDDYAAFTNVDYISVDGSVNKSITLYRPFGQLNIATNLPKTFTSEVANTAVSVAGAAHVYNVATKKAEILKDDEGNELPVTFAAAAPIKNGENYLPFGDYDRYISMNYVFVPEETATVSVTYDINTVEHGTVNNTISNVPVAKNFKTNIIGNLLTSEAKYSVELNKDWETPDAEVYVWDGSEMTAPKQVSETQYEIAQASELAWFAAAVNGTLPETKATIAADSFAGKTFVLTEDVDLGGQEWTPIGNSSNKFMGTFDGQKHTVKNLKGSGYNSNVGLFGVTHDGEIKNLVVENAEVSGRLNVGVVAGQPYTSKYTNITVKGHVEVNGMAYVGAVGGKDAYADWTNVKVEVDETEGPSVCGGPPKFEEWASKRDAMPSRIVRMRKVSFIDSTGLHNLEIFIDSALKVGQKVILSGVNKRVYNSIVSVGIVDKIGKENVLDHIDLALSRAAELSKTE